MATIQILGTEELFALNESQIGIGRAPDNEIAVNDGAVSGYHAMISSQPSSKDPKVMVYILEDLESTNKTYVNNKPVTKHVLLHGDIIKVGKTRLKFSMQEYDPPPPDLKETQELKSVEVSDFLYTKQNN